MAKKKQPDNTNAGETLETEEKGIVLKSMEDVMHESMIPYSEYVILDRALPRVEDGLKPVQRRILFDMLELGLHPDRPFRKCARVVGDCLGKYHPHGDSSVYQALVRMAQPFNMGSTLVDGQGNFGDIDGNGAAAMRYTEAKLTPLAMELLKDLGEPKDELVRWSCNFDDSLMEPDMLPGRFPNLLVNGASGIAVGLATNIPTHNLGESIDAAVAFIDNPTIKLKEIMKIIKGPDFPTGGYIIAGDELEKAYRTGRGKITVRAKMHIENADNDKRQIVIDELPYQVNKAALLENIMKIREEKKGALMGISDIADESDRNGMRAVIRVKKDCDPGEIIAALFKSTNLSTTFGINMVAIAEAKPKLMGLMEIIEYYVNYQRDFIVRRTRHELDMAKKREHILEGLVIAVQNIDEVIAIIKASKSTPEAKENLKKRFELSDRQAEAILDLRLARLTRLEVFKLEQELKELRERIKYLTAVLGSKKMQMEIVKTEMLEIKKAYNQKRRSIILKDEGAYKVADNSVKIEIEDSAIVMTARGNVKRMTLKYFHTIQRTTFESGALNEIAPVIVDATGAERIMCFTSLGNCYKFDISLIEEGKWRDKGMTLQSLFPEADPDERIVYIQVVGKEVPDKNLLIYTAGGMVKKSAWSEYNVGKTSFLAVKLKEGDTVVGAEEEREGCSLMFVTRSGMCLNAEMNDIPIQGRVSGGVRGIQLNDGDGCVMIRQIGDGGEVVVVTDRGYAKRVIAADIDVMARYRKGVKIIDFKASNGAELVFAGYVTHPYQVILKVNDDYLSAFSTEAISIESRTNAGKALVKGKNVDIREVYVYNTRFTNG
ncbi:MAG: DNA topoisomerase 4 subunit A [Clostridiales bacterium]|jgi:DNA gyrase subunit A|nr:DNA topoisomerase 4 subunit A [Clostridiales bacterium]